MDFSIPLHLPVEAQQKLQELIFDYQEENLTPKGYNKKRLQLLDQYKYQNHSNDTSSSFSGKEQSFSRGSLDSDRKRPPIHGKDGSFNSALTSNQYVQSLQTTAATDLQALHRLSTTTTSTDTSNGSTTGTGMSRLGIQTHNSGFSVSTSNNTSESKSNPTPSETLSSLAKANSTSIRSSVNRHHRRQSSLISLPFDSMTTQYNPMTPILPRVDKLPPSFKGASLTAILHSRSVSYSKETAMISVNSKGKEKVVSWNKLQGKSERIAQELTRDKQRKIYKMDKILLWFDQDDIFEFASSLFGCFCADMIAVPVSFETYTLNEIIEIIKLTNSKNVLISDNCFKSLENLFTENGKVKLLKSDFFQHMNFIKTGDLGTSSKSNNVNNIPSISYIEFTRTPLGRLSGVIMKHKILENQFELFAQVLNSRNSQHEAIRPLQKVIRSKKKKYNILNTMDCTRNTGLIFGILYNVYSGNLMINVNSKFVLRTSGALESLVDKYRVNVLLCDQLQLKQVVINYLDNPTTQKKGSSKFDFSCIKFCLTTCTTIDTEVSDMIVQKWLKNLGCLGASQCYSPILTMPDFGGCFVAMRDQLNLGVKRVSTMSGQLTTAQVDYDDDCDNDGDNEEDRPTSKKHAVSQTNGRISGYSKDDIYVEKEHLKKNVIRVSSQPMLNATTSAQKYIKMSAFGFPLVDSYLVVVNPDDATLVQDSTVGEIWISTPSMTNEFYHMDRVTDFVFNARLNYAKMFKMLERSNAIPQSLEKLKTTMQICTPETRFLRTKLIGFVHSNKIYVLSLVEDMILQNKLIRLPNGLHTSNMGSSSDSQSILNDSASNKDLGKNKRVVQTHYLQHITENLVRTVEHVQEVSAFELTQFQSEHFLIFCVESDLVGTNTQPSASLDKKLSPFVDKMYKILWIFHRIQPMCIMILPCGALPRRFCSLEIANSTVEKRYLNAQLNIKFLKFQLENVILDFIPSTSFENESIFSEHLSNLRHSSVEDAILRQGNVPSSLTNYYQISHKDIVDKSVDSRTQMVLNDFKSILDLLEFRCNNQGNDSAYCDGYASAVPNNSNNYHKSVTWNNFNNMVGSFLKKILESKTPLKSGDSIAIIAENSVEYVAMVMTALYCGFKIILIPCFNTSSNPQSQVDGFLNVISSYKVKRIFTDYKTDVTLQDNNTPTGKILKKLKQRLPRITLFSKIKVKAPNTIKFFKSQIKTKLGSQSGSSIVFVDKNDDLSLKLTTVFKAETLFELCKQYKETLQLSSDYRLLSVCDHTAPIGFMKSCLLGIYVGATTTLYSIADVRNDPSEFFMDLKNLKIKDLFLNNDLLTFILIKAKDRVLRNIANVLLPTSGRPDHYNISKLLANYPQAGCSMNNLNYIYQNKFNPFISLRTYSPLSIFLDCESLRVGVLKEVDPVEEPNCIEVHDSGIPVCENLIVVNPETRKNTYFNELGEILVSSNRNVDEYSLLSKSGKLLRDAFLTDQLRTKVGNKKYIRTGDLGFVRPYIVGNKQENVLFVLSEVNNTIESSGFYCIGDLEKTIESISSSILKCLVAKMGGFTISLVQIREDKKHLAGNFVSIIVNSVLQKHKLIINLVCFVDNLDLSRSKNIQKFIKNDNNYIYGVYKNL